MTPEQAQQLAQLEQASNAGFIDLQEAKHHGIDTSAGKPWRDQLARIRAAAARKTLAVPATTPATATPIPADTP